MFAFLAVQMTATLASTKRKKNEEEAKENSINYGLYTTGDSFPSKVYNTMLHDATLPVFLVMGLASVVSTLSSVSSQKKNLGNKLCHTSFDVRLLETLSNIQFCLSVFQ